MYACFKRMGYEFYRSYSNWAAWLCSLEVGRCGAEQTFKHGTITVPVHTRPRAGPEVPDVHICSEDPNTKTIDQRLVLCVYLVISRYRHAECGSKLQQDLNLCSGGMTDDVVSARAGTN